MGNKSETGRFTKKDLGKVARRAGFAASAVLGVAGLFVSADEVKASDHFYNIHQAQLGEETALQNRYDSLKAQDEKLDIEFNESTKRFDSLGIDKIKYPAQISTLAQAAEAIEQAKKNLELISKGIEEAKIGNNIARTTANNALEKITIRTNITDIQTKEYSSTNSSLEHGAKATAIGIPSGLLVIGGVVGVIAERFVKKFLK